MVDIRKDRWIEVDLGWFQPDRMAHSAQAFMQRMAPLYQDVAGSRGIILCCGWILDLITEWTGDPCQPLPFQTKLLSNWKSGSYDDLRKMVGALREAAVHIGVDDLKIGFMFVAWGQFVMNPEIEYDVFSKWYERHPELYPRPQGIFPNLDPGVPLHEDSYPYATRPQGIQQGEAFQSFLGDQWGVLSAFLELDAIHLRDQFAGEMIYIRKGPFGDMASPDPDETRRISEHWITLFREVKRGNPHAVVMGYSSAVSAVADWRTACVDFEDLVADGAIDIWIDQTWPGAWVDWRMEQSKSWTFELAYLMTHQVMIAKANEFRSTPCKHYHLVETWDAWEHWDTLHTVPEKLRWGIWAYSHAAVQHPEGIRVPDGAYISWANHRSGRLWSDQDIAFLKEVLDEAQLSADRIEAVYGPRLVYNRSMMQWLSDHHPDWNVCEWIDEQVGWLIKWGVPCLSATRTEWLGDLNEDAREGWIVQTPGQLDESAKTALREAHNRKHPLLFSGRADVLDPELLAMAGGCLAKDEELPRGYTQAELADCMEETDLSKAHQVFLTAHRKVAADREGTIWLHTDRTALLTSNSDGTTFYWQPMDWFCPEAVVLQFGVQVGSVDPYVLTGRRINKALERSGVSYAMEVPKPLPISLHYWRSGGAIHVLAGNLETGSIGDSRTPRHGSIVFRRAHLGLGDSLYRLREVHSGFVVETVYSDDREIHFSVALEPNGAGIYRLEACLA